MKTLVIFSLLLFGFLYYAEGTWINPFALWNAMPLALAVLLYWIGRRSENRAARWGAIGFLVVSMALSLPAHLAWMFDWDGTRTASSTSALLLLFLPVYASGLGLIGFAFGWGLSRVVQRRAGPTDHP